MPKFLDSTGLLTLLEKIKSAFVSKTSDETIDGTKTFSSTISGSISGNAATATKVGKNLVLKIKTGTSEGTSLYTYNGSAAKTLDIKQGSNVTLTAASSALTIAATTSSDARMKTDIADIPNEVLDAWERLKWTQFKYKRDVKEEGAKAKTHFGLMAQDVNEALAQEKYSFTEVVPNNDEATQGDISSIWTMNYIEALILEAAYQRRKADRLEARIAALEEKLK